MVFTIVTELGKHHNSFLTLSLPPKDTPYPLAVTSHSSFNYTLCTYILCLQSVSIHLSIMDFSYKWNHTLYGLFCLTSFT